MPNLKDIGSNVIANLIAGAIIFAISAIYAFYSNNPEKSLLLLGIALLIVNIFLTMRLLISFNQIQRMFDDFDQQFQQFQERVVRSGLFPEPNVSGTPPRHFRYYFEMTNRDFNEENQKIILEFTNRSEATISVREVTFSSKTGGLQESDIRFKHRSSLKYRSPLIEFDRDKAIVSSGDTFLLEIPLEHSFSKNKIMSKFGELAYLHLYISYQGEEEDIQYAI